MADEKKVKEEKETKPNQETQTKEPAKAKEQVKKKEAGKEEKKEKPVKKKEKKNRKVSVKKTKEVEELQKEIKAKKDLPTFRGRFGKRNIRKKSKAKWDKWRVPRGIDVSHVVSDGFDPKEGYRTPRSVRDVHPSGYKEFVVRTEKEIEKIPKNHAIRIVAGLGRKKKLAIVDKAIEKGVKVLNP